MQLQNHVFICFEPSDYFQILEKCQCSYFLHIHCIYIFSNCGTVSFRQIPGMSLTPSLSSSFFRPLPFTCLDGFLFFNYYFFSFLFLSIITTNAVPDDQSPSSPASRWPGANYGNRTLGVFLFFFFTRHHPPF